MTQHASSRGTTPVQASPINDRTHSANLIPSQAPTTPNCCQQPAMFERAMGIEDIRRQGTIFEGGVLWHIVYQLHLFGMPAARLLETLDADSGPRLNVYRCPRCGQKHFHIDQA